MRRPDSFSLAMLSVIAVASLAPPSADLLHTLSPLATAAVALLFFVHGASLARDAILAGIGQWRLHLFVLSITFLGFPLLLVPLTHLPLPNVPNALVLGILYLAVLPSAVSSSIAFTAMARGCGNCFYRSSRGSSAAPCCEQSLMATRRSSPG
jgi:sodium/bile acid cotransporter 7